MKNIIFVMGPFRSGTTWMWGLLSSHPDIYAITKDNLGIGTSFNNEGKLYTAESSIFFNYKDDNFIKQAFDKVKRNEKYLLEKTPQNILHIDRIKTLFPQSKLICMRRNVLDILTSQKCFFPNQVFSVTAVNVNKETEIIQEQRDKIDIIVDYEKLLINTKETLTNLLNKLNLSTDKVTEIISQNHRKILLHNREGVFRKGIIGDWKNNLTPTEINIVKSLKWHEDWINWQ